MSIFDQRNLRKLVGCPDIAIDLGTANTRLYATGYGMIADEPSMVSLAQETGAIAAVGREAERLATFGNDFTPVYPLNSGVVSDIDAAASLLRHLLERLNWPGILRPRAIACVPTDACEDERQSLIEATQRAGASAVFLVPEPLAAAIGAGLEISSPYAQMLVDIGDGVTDIAVIRSGQLVTTAAVRTACSDLHVAISDIVARRYGISLFPHEAQRLTHRLGSPLEMAGEQWFFAEGIDQNSTRHVKLRVSSLDLAEAIEPVLKIIIEAIHQTVRDLPPETSCEVIEGGICLTGGGANLRGICQRLSLATSLDVHTAPDPMRAVINGARQMLAVGAETNLWQHVAWQ